MVLPDSNGISRVPPYSGASLAVFDFAYGTVTLCGHPCQNVLLSNYGSIIEVLQPRMVETTRFGLIPVRSPLLGESLLISTPSGTEMFHFPEFASQSLCIQLRDNWTLLQLGCPILKFPGQRMFVSSPELIAACHVLHRLLTPRHPPIALNIFLIQSITLFICQ